MSGMAPTRRQMAILEWLDAQGSLTIAQLAERFQVSVMTIHRDLDKLADDGYARKVRGGVLPAVEPGSQISPTESCTVCGKRVPARTRWVITRDDGQREPACCAHCGFLHLAHGEQPQSALAVDYLYGRMVNVYQAIYVVGSDVTPCCVPSTLCFATRHDAERFRHGFGGQVMDFAAALQAMNQLHHSTAMAEAQDRQKTGKLAKNTHPSAGRSVNDT